MESTKGKLIQLLEKHKDKYVSGQFLSKQLEVSRNTVWKHMKSLEVDGYSFEAKSRVGYKLLEEPKQLNAASIRYELQTEWLGQHIIFRPTVTSTQHVAHEQAQQNCPNGTIVVSDQQTAGKGRLNRQWDSSLGKGLWFSIVLRPPIQPLQAPQITLLTATVLAETLASNLGVDPQIKWPNDLLLSSKKIAGILTEMQAEQDQIQYMVIGIGLNVLHELDDFPPELHRIATSLKIETGKSWERNAILKDFLSRFEKRYEEYLQDGFPNVKERWEQYGFKIGKAIRIKTFHEEWEATFQGISDDGALLTEDHNGKQVQLYSAEIDWFHNEERR